MKIIIIGGGIGGLALAAGLKRRNVEVRVFERDTDPAQTGGYHITLHEPVQRALSELLDAPDFETILASCADGKRRDPDVFWDWRGRLFWRMNRLDDPGIDIDRVSLRLLLAKAAGDALVLGKVFVGYSLVGDEVEARFADGSTERGDVLVGADGTQSLVVRQMLGTSTNLPAGVVGVSGRTLVKDLSPSLRDQLGMRSSLAMGPHGLALYFGYLDPVGRSVIDRPDLRAALTTEPTFIWGAMFPEDDPVSELRGQSGQALLDGTIASMTARHWSRRLLEVVEKSQVDGVAMYRFNAASSDPRQLAPWLASRVTALGDAVHATPPTAGMGAGIAIRDAADLMAALVLVGESKSALLDAIGSFEARMRLRGAEAIAQAMKIIGLMKSTNTPIGRVASKVLISGFAAWAKAAKWE